MKDLSKEIMAYVLQNAIEFDKADASKILPKLFQHGLGKKDIGEIMPLIHKIVKEVNSMNQDKRKKAFSKLKGIVKKREEKERFLPPLKDSEKKSKITFRAAPFPSGALHIGNAKIFILNSLYAEKYDGRLILVMDDTIGSAEKPLLAEGYDLIKEAFEWLGIKYNEPIIYKSNRLKIYYKFAKELIKKDKAYVCHCSVDDLRKNRKIGTECSCRQFPQKIQLARWKEMFNTREGKATLRIKTNMQDPNPAFRDRVLFKISEREHPLTGDKYKVWPTLEMSWAIDDHELGVTHIIRGNDLAIETDMENYIWDIFGWKHAETIHTGIVSIKEIGAKLSKSKARKEILSGEFVGWDDPRTWSIQSLKRRGILSQAIKQFIREIGLNKQDITIPIESLYSINRRMVDGHADRYSFVENPIELKIKDRPRAKLIDVPIHPDKQEMKKVKAGKIYISKKDFDKYKGEEIRLLHLYNIKLKDNSKITSTENKKIQKINWVSESVPVSILMPDGKTVVGIGEANISKIKREELIQFERFGFCKYDGKKKGAYHFWFAHN